MNEAPGALAHHTATVHNENLYVLGGTNYETTERTPFYKLNLRTNEWVKLESPEEYHLNRT